MPSVEARRKIVKSSVRKVGEVSIPNQENAQNNTNAKKLLGILKIKNPLIIEEIAESDLLA